MPASKRFKREARREVRRLRSERTTEAGLSSNELSEAVTHIIKALKIVSGGKSRVSVPGWKRNLRDIENGLTTERNALMGLRAEITRRGG